jgi:hypothetical protein
VVVALTPLFWQQRKMTILQNFWLLQKKLQSGGNRTGVDVMIAIFGDFWRKKWRFVKNQCYDHNFRRFSAKIVFSFCYYQV